MISTSLPSGLVPDDQHAVALERGPIVVVELVAVPVPLADDLRPVGLRGPGCLRSAPGPNAPSRIVPPFSVTSCCSSSRQTTGSAHWRSNSVVLAPSKSEHVAGELDHGALHAQADAEERDAAFAGEADRLDLALDAAIAEAAGHEHAVDAAQHALGALALDLLGLDLADDAPGVDGRCRRGRATRRPTCRRRGA